MAKMNTERYMEMVNLRRCGYTYEEIGKKLGVSRQYVHQVIGKRFRGDLNNITRVHLREWFRQTQMSVESFTENVLSVASKSNKNKIYKFLKGEKSWFKLEHIIRMCELTGLNIYELNELERE